MDVSHPSSPNYGKHWTNDEVTSMFAPSEEAVRDVFEWLKDAGFDGEGVKYMKSKGVSSSCGFLVSPSESDSLNFAPWSCLSVHRSKIPRSVCRCQHVARGS